MKVGIIGAMDQEILLLRNRMKHCKMICISGSKFYTGTLHNIETILLKSGIGKVSAAISTVLLLERKKPELVINIGSAGSLSPSLDIGDIVISSEVRYHDVDATAFGYKLSQIPGCPISFSADKELINIAESCIQKLNLHAVRGLVISGDSFINSSKIFTYIRTVFPKAIAVEMEAAAIGHVCYQFSIPFIAIRSISDLSNHESHISFRSFLRLAAMRSTLLVDKMLLHLADS